MRQFDTTSGVIGGIFADEVTFATPFAAVMPRLRVHCEERFGLGCWDVYMPAYLFGWDRANRPDLDESLWEEAVPGLRAEWSRRHPERPWAEVEEAVLAAWEKAHSLASANWSAPRRGSA